MRGSTVLFFPEPSKSFLRKKWDSTNARVLPVKTAIFAVRPIWQEIIFYVPKQPNLRFKLNPEFLLTKILNFEPITPIYI
jgi:hypothetical protein